MTGKSAERSAELVPLADRHLYLQWYRVLVILAVLAAYAVWPDQRGLAWSGFAWASGCYALLTAVTHGTWRLRRSLAITAFGGMVLADGLYLCVVTYGSAGLGTPLQYLVLAHLVTVTLLASFRTGLKVALWHTLLLASVYELERRRVLHPRSVALSPNSLAMLSTTVGLVLVVTMATSMFAAVNERELRRRNFDLHALARLAWTLEASLAPQQVGGALMDALRDDFGVTRALIADDHLGQLRLLSGFGLAPQPPTTDPAADRLEQTVMSGRKPVLLRGLDAAEAPWLCAVLPDAVNLLLLPLHANGKPVAVLVAETGCRPGSRIERRVVAIIERCASYAALALASAWLLDRNRSMAATDALTGIGNRRLFDDVLDHTLAGAGAGRTPVACLMIDIDHFKQINDRFGHQAGDDVIKSVATAIAAHCRPTDTAARYGGEEFVVLLPGVGERSIAVDRAEQIRAFVAGMPGPIPVSVSVGVAVYPQTVQDPAELVHTADLALYEAKQAGRNRVLAAVGEQAAG